MLLILVLAVLAMFALIAVAFVVLTGHYRRITASHQRIEQVMDPPKKLLRQAAMQVFRGPTTHPTTGLPTPDSAIGPHSLLEDIYGNEFYGGFVNNTPTPLITSDGVHGQLVNIPISISGITPTELARCNGCVLTITGVPTGGVAAEQLALYGQSTRIVAVDATNSIVQVAAFSNGATPPINTTFTINGVPFSGTGFGFDSSSNDLDRTLDITNADPTTWSLSSVDPNDTHLPVALLPNLPPSLFAGGPFPPGGANEDYDAADMQNMMLAAQVARTGPSGIDSVYTIPSLHRPALVRYWFDKLCGSEYDSYWPGGMTADDRMYALKYPLGTDGIKGTADDPVALDPTILAIKRKIMLRPLSDDHPNFNGGNPYFNPAWFDVSNYNTGPGQWDVDCDGDGDPDSVWVDLGMPVRHTADGRLYKPLFAILCVDLDGRLNLNAHGSLPQTNTNYNTLASQLGGTFAGSPTAIARGQGLGPAEINLRYLLGDAYPQYLMIGNGGYQGRYGTDGAAGTHYPGLAAIDPLTQYKWFDYGAGYGYGANYWTFADADNEGDFGSPPDPFGVGAVGLDQAGRPVYMKMFDALGPTYLQGYGSGVEDCPYELNLDANQTRGEPSNLATVDNPFSPAELERVLRPFDRDAPALPDRLAQLTAATVGDPKTSGLFNIRHSLTTESWDLPAPGVGLHDGVRVRHITDLLTARGIPQSAWPRLLPPDLLAGLRMDVNRPFGDGLDNNTNGIVDEPGESNEIFGTSSFSYDGADGALASDSLEARQLMARYLYVLAMLVADTDEIRNRLGGATDAELARFLAQWAVNAVDFKDRDSIMTPFEYDVYPFADNDATPNNPWDVDGRIGTTALPSPDDTQAYRGLVWGCERPELIFGETIALHDRRTEDLANEQHDPTDPDDDSTASGRTDDPDPNQDASFDQRYRPQGSLFIELYNPWTAQEPRPVELCDAPNGGVDLTKITPGGNSPVWRIITVNETDAAKDPDDWDAGELPAIERAVYFVGPSDGATLPGDGSVSFQPNDNFAARIPPILPGRYAVIGPGDESDDANSITYLGFQNNENPGNVDTSPNSTRRIVLTPPPSPDPNPNTSNQVEVYNDGTTNDVPSNIQPPVAIVINHPRRLSISEPDAGYPDNSPAGTPYNETNGYTPPYDQPQDTQVPSPLAAEIAENNRYDHIQVIHLQRLANPLLPYDADTNPYRTIDRVPVDLTTFNGLTSDTDPKANGTLMSTINFFARQRGQNNGTSPGNPNLWSQEPVDSEPTANVNDVPSDATNHVFNRALNHTLGYLSDPFFPLSAIAGCEGSPENPFSWLTWNNRPYVSPLEMMQVSWMRSSKLLDNYRMADPSDDPYTEPWQPFSHLLNFFPSGTPSSPNEELHRVFEFLRVPSPFAGTETWANPTIAATTNDHNFHPPFNRISAYREPGKINLNTIYDNDVFYALMNGFPGMGASSFWREFIGSRQGAGGPANRVFGCATGMPTEFARPFRSFGGRALTPSVMQALLDREIDCTLLRPDPADDATPLFQHNSDQPADNTDRNPYFRYQGIQRLANLTTTRSNVYAVWITVGYFEVTPRPTGYDIAIYPDGYELGRELGVDTGEIERHRAFYIFDRSIPVGFQRGQDLNVDKAILVDRFIE
ncbi:MAG: hypothetical protein JW959_10385 [Pirellulales bacterium]|nr:hypothetical protein [Pirellulales bacterium]